MAVSIQKFNDEKLQNLERVMSFGTLASMHSHEHWVDAYLSRGEPIHYRTSVQLSPWVIAGSCVVLVLSGTGGNISTLRALDHSGGLTTLQSPAPSFRLERKRILTVQERIRAIKAAFGLTISDLAAVLAVGRPAIYDWLGGSEPRKKNLDRILQVHGLAQYWTSMVNGSLRNLLRSTFEDGHNILELLIQDELAPDKIHADLDALAKITNQSVMGAPKISISERLRSGHFRPAPPETRATTRSQLGPSWLDEE